MAKIVARVHTHTCNLINKKESIKKCFINDIYSRAINNLIGLFFDA